MDVSPTEPTADQRPRTRKRRWLLSAGLGLSLCALLLGGSALAASSATRDNLQQDFLDRLAGKLGITTEELNTAIEAAGNETVDAALANGEITEDQAAALKERIADGNAFRFGGFGHGKWRHFGGPGLGLETIATTLGMTTDELRAELKAGTALTDIITAQGSTVEQVVDALVAEAEARLAEKVAAGDITQAQADALLAELPARLTDAIENGCVGPGRHHGTGMPGWENQDSDTEAETTGV
ncbi:MAG: hypothetical protein DCC58_15855 [Chloroflexi bacterium]|nr:MAG: hypothetical protein DCC58_15855 [Chloroflexota bacterium]